MSNASSDSKFKRLLARWGKRLLIIPPIVIAVGILIFFTTHRAAPKVKTEGELSRALSVISAPEMEVEPRVIGFGTAQYAKKWRAVSQVSGRIKEIHDEFRPGTIIGAGEVLLKIDDADYRSAAEELAAFIQEKEAEIAQLEQTKINYDKTLAIEQSAMAVMAVEMKRTRSLVARNAESQSAIDTARRSEIAQQKTIQDIENSKSLIEPQILGLKASIRQSTAQLEKAKRDIERSEIRAPFTMRIGDVELELDQYVAANEALFEGFSFSDMEIEVQISMQDVTRLQAVPPADQPPPEQLTMEIMRNILPISPTVEISGGETNAVYEGRFLRVREVVDAQTRQLGIVIGVTNKPKLTDGRPRAAVLEGAFCKVTLRGESIGKRVVIPRTALHGKTVYVVNENNRLAKREVELEFFQDDVAVIANGLPADQQVIIANPSPAVEGMLVEPMPDNSHDEMLKNAVR